VCYFWLFIYYISFAGGTIDITVQEVQVDGSIKQLYMANGGDWGGTKVDQAFEQFLMELAGDTTVSSSNISFKVIGTLNVVIAVPSGKIDRFLISNSLQRSKCPALSTSRNL
jgi:hypothetical protein